MMKIKIEGIDVYYKNVAELNKKLQDALTDVQSTKAKAAAELRALTKQERALTRFLGVQESEAQPALRGDTAAPGLR